LARTHQTPFSARLVSKFELPTSGWRGPMHQVHPVATGQVPMVDQSVLDRPVPGGQDEPQNSTPVPSPKHL